MPKHETRIKGADSIVDVMYKMSEGNPGALTTLMSIMESSDKIDPDSLMGGMGKILFLDTLGIYGTDIYILHNDICKRNIVNTLAVLRAVQLGLFDGGILQDACHRQDYSGVEMVPVSELYEKVKKKLPQFNSEQ